MRQPIRTLVWISGLMAAASFGYVLIFAPIEEPGQGDFGDQAVRVVSVRELDRSFRDAFGQGRLRAAEGFTKQMIQAYPKDPASWYSRGVVLDRLEMANEATQAWAELLQLASAVPEAGEIRQQARRAYFRGWGEHGLGLLDQAQASFGRALVLYEQSLNGNTPTGVDAYNLACYAAMGGQIEVALGHWAQAFDTGFTNQSSWWVADPDLDPIRDDPRFIDIVRAEGPEGDSAVRIGG